MNNEENKIVENQENNYVDPRNIQAEVIGQLKNDKIGKPILIVIFSVFILCVMVSLPYINSYINDENGFIYKFLNPTKVSTGTINNNANTNTGYADGSKAQILNSTSKFKLDNIVISKCSIGSKSIKCMINSFNGILDLDSENYALEIYSNSNNLMGSIKLYGTYDYTEKEIELFDESINFNTNLSYYGKIVVVSEEDIPEFTLSVNELGEQVLICTKDNEHITYKFNNSLLIGYEESITINNNGDSYNTELEKYREKAALMPNNTYIEESDNSFIYIIKADLYNDMLPEDYKSSNYFDLNETGKKIHYSQISKGYDCK